MPGIDPKMEQVIQDAKGRIAAGFNPVEEIKNIIPLLVIDPAEYNERFLTDRRAVASFAGIADFRDLAATVRSILREAVNPVSYYWGDVQILCLIGPGEEEAKEARRIIQGTPQESPRIVLAVHNDNGKICDNLKEFKATGSLFTSEKDPNAKRLLEERLQELRARLDKELAWKNWKWYYMNGIIEPDEFTPPSILASRLMEKLFPGSFNPIHRALSTHHKPDPQYRMMTNGLLRKILDFSEPIGIPPKDIDRTGELINALYRLNILHPLDEKAKDEWEVEPNLPENSPLRYIWNFLFVEVLARTQKNSEEIIFDKISRHFMDPPNGITENLSKILFALFWRCYHNYLDLYDSRTFDQKIAGRLDPNILETMLKTPREWKIVKTGQKPSKKEVPATELLGNEEKYMRAVARLFDPEGFNEDRLDYTWDEVRDSAIRWVSRFSQVLQDPAAWEPQLFSLMKILEEGRQVDSRELFLAHVPAALGLEPNAARLVHDHKVMERAVRKAVEDAADTKEDLSVRSKKVYKKKSNVAWDALDEVLSMTVDSGDMFKPSAPSPPSYAAPPPRELSYSTPQAPPAHKPYAPPPAFSATSRGPAPVVPMAHPRPEMTPLIRTSGPGFAPPRPPAMQERPYSPPAPAPWLAPEEPATPAISAMSYQPPAPSGPPHEEESPSTGDTREDLWIAIAGLFQAPPHTSTQEIMDKWLTDIKADKYTKAYRGDTKALYDLLVQKSADRHGFLEILPEKMGMGPMSTWDTDKAPELLARIDKARFQMSVMKYIEMKALPKTEKGKAFIVKWLAKILQHLRLSRKESRQFLQGYLAGLQ